MPVFRSLLLFFIMLSTCLCATDSESPPPVASTPTDIAAQCQNAHFLIDGKVNAVTGALCLHHQDVVALGAQPIVLTRSYTTPSLPERYHEDAQPNALAQCRNAPYYGVWVFAGHLNAKRWESGSFTYIQLSEPNGLKLDYRVSPSGEVLLRGIHYGIQSLGLDGPTATLDPRRIQIVLDKRRFTVVTPKGIRREYVQTGPRYQLSSERLPSGHLLRYTYNEKTVTITSHDPQGTVEYACLTLDHRPEGMRVATNTGLHAELGYTKRACRRYWSEWINDRTHLRRSGQVTSPPLITSASTPYFRAESITYSPSYLLEEWESANEHFRCTYTRHPYGVDSLCIPLDDGYAASHHMVYDRPVPGHSGGTTRLERADGTIVVYHISPELRITAIEYFDDQGAPHSSTSYTWNEEGQLLSQAWLDEEGTTVQTRHFGYDSQGDPIQETVRGDRQYSIRRTYAQDAFHLVLTESHDNGLHTEYQYLEGTNLPTARFVGDGTEIWQRQFWVYDQCHNLIEWIEDDGTTSQLEDTTGITERRITRYHLRQTQPFLHMPERIEEIYVGGDQKETVLRKTHCDYDTHGHLSTEKVYGADGRFAYELKTIYNERGNVVEETNCLQQTATHTYDPKGRLLTTEHFSGDRTTKRVYTPAGWLVQKQETPHQGLPRTDLYTYNPLGHLCCHTNYRGLDTHYTYDPTWQEVCQKTGPPTSAGPIVSCSIYDAAGRLIEAIDPCGHCTHTTYNIRSQPTSISHPDGGVERFDYTPDWCTETATDPDGIITVTTRDPLGRVTRVDYGDGIVDSYSYKGFRLHSHTDKAGYKTTYRYDGAGRKIEENREGRITRYSYDSLGYLASETLVNDSTTGNTLYHRDCAGRVVCKEERDETGRVCIRTQYQYDAQGNLSTTLYGDGASRTAVYDAFGRLHKTINEHGEVTTHTYTVLGDTEVCTTQLPGGNVVTTTLDPYDKILSRLETRNDTPLSHTLWIYDAYHRPIQRTDPIYHDGRLLRTEETYWSYDPCGRMTLESSAPLTREYYYTRAGRLHLETCGDIGIGHTYDAQGRLIQIATGDTHGNEVGYTYRRDALGRIIAASDRTHTTRRTYDPFGNVLKETLAHGLVITKSYDARNRPLTLTIPDGRTITYTYDALHLRTVTLDGKTHSYETYDQRGSLLQETTIYGDPISYTLDPTARRIHVSSPHWEQSINSWNADRHPTTVVTNGIPEQFAYDPLSQLICEPTQTHTFDSNYNPLPMVPQSHDTAGRLQTRESFVHTYDPLDRLLSARAPGLDVTFTYDPFGRRLSKSVNGEELESYFYDGMTEIGAFTPTGVQLKLTGIIEIEGTAYATVQDLRGNIACLVDSETSYPHHYTAFGQENSPLAPFFNPWRFAGKRLDPHLHLYDFGARLYDPVTGRWLTPDPIGLAQCQNPWAFCFNNPWCYVDPDGRVVICITIALGAAFSWEAILMGAAITTAASAGIAGICYTVDYFSNRPVSTVNTDYLVSDWYTESQNTPTKTDDKPKRDQRSSSSSSVQESEASGTIYVDPSGNALPSPRGGTISTSPNGQWIQVRDANNQPTGVRIDGPHKPQSHSDPRAQERHGHRPGITNEDGSPWLPLKS